MDAILKKVIKTITHPGRPEEILFLKTTSFVMDTHTQTHFAHFSSYYFSIWQIVQVLFVHFDEDWREREKNKDRAEKRPREWKWFGPVILNKYCLCVKHFAISVNMWVTFGSQYLNSIECALGAPTRFLFVSLCILCVCVFQSFGRFIKLNWAREFDRRLNASSKRSTFRLEGCWEDCYPNVYPADDMREREGQMVRNSPVVRWVARTEAEW